MRKKVSFDYYVLLFFLVSFLGWGWEVCLYLVREGRFVNRGILSGPWLPIYGAGGLFLYFLFSALMPGGWKRKQLPVFLLSMAFCSVLEYLAGSLLERAWGVKWWDYSGMPFNLNGHICLMSCLMFGIGGLFLVFVLLPAYTGLYHRMPEKARLAAGLLLLGLFIMDAAHSADFPNAGRGITYRG
ncbi:MAG: putative ABC transporter permease [Blautia sp.]|nr:putative ABC transporter permease [Blautia sp.]